MRYILFLTVFYIFIIICQLVYLKYFVTLELPELQNKINWNIHHMDFIQDRFKEVLTSRVTNLKNKKMSYDDWIKYNLENMLVEIDDKKYYIFVFEMLPNTNYQRLITKVHGNREYINLSWEDVLKDVQDHLIILKHTTDSNLIANMYDLCSRTSNSVQQIEYYWLDPLSLRPVNKLSNVLRYDDPETGRTGVIGVGLDLKDLSIDNSYIYWQKINWHCPIFVSVFVYIATIILYKINANKIQFKSFFFFIILNIYLTYFLGMSEVSGTTSSEQQKENTINSGIMSVSFLFAVNIFILTTLQKSFHTALFTESGFVFSLSVLLLLFSMIKTTDKKTTEQIMSARLCTQLLFNCSIILNTLIIFNYIIYLLSKSVGKKIIN